MNVTQSDEKRWRVRRRQPQPLATRLSRHSLLSQVTCKFGSLGADDVQLSGTWKLSGDENTMFNAERLFIYNSDMDVTVRPC